MSGFRILPEVAEDIAEAANWYDEKDIPAWASDSVIVLVSERCESLR